MSLGTKLYDHFWNTVVGSAVEGAKVGAKPVMHWMEESMELAFWALLEGFLRAQQ